MQEYQEKSYKSGGWIMQEGEEPDYAFILKSGSVEVVKKRADGIEVVLRKLSMGDIFGEVAMVDAMPRSAGVRALEDVRVILVDRETFDQKQKALDPFTFKLMRSLITRLRHQNQVIAELSNPATLAKAAKKGQLEVEKKPSHTNVLYKEDYRDKINFGAIRLLLGDKNSQSRQSIKGGLHLQGFREIEETASGRDLLKRVKGSSLDLMVLDSNLGLEAMTQVIKKVRHAKTTVSPFCVIFAVIDQPEPKMLEDLSDAGLDDVLVKPISVGNIVDRVERRIKRRKEFVVTMDYVGPDRRSVIRPGSEVIPLVDVPNPLAFRALGDGNVKQYASDCANALALIEDLKIERYAVQVDWLFKKIEHWRKTGQDPKYFMERLIDMTEILKGLLEEKKDQTHVDLCELILSSVEDFKSGIADVGEMDWMNLSGFVAQILDGLGPKES